MNNFELYKLAIEERKHLLSNYNTWMNIYAIINGALFVGFYTVSDEHKFISLPITFCGFLAGVAWFLFIKSYYSWIVSWIKVVCYYESKLKKNKKIYLYRLFGNKNKPLSTQKISKAFTLCISILWLGLFIYSITKFLPENSSFIEFLCSRSIPNGVFCFIFLVLFIVVIICLFNIFRNGLRDDLKNSHMKLTQSDVDTFVVGKFQ